MCQPDNKLAVLGDFLHALKIALERGQVIQVPVGHQAKPAAGSKVVTALCQQMLAGKFIHRVTQVKGRVTQDQLHRLAAVTQQAVALVKGEIIRREYLIGV